MSWRIETFRKELFSIQDNKVRKFTEELIDRLPDYFFKIPASSSGKYHPPYALGEGGLVRHTKAAVGIALELFRMEEYQNKFNRYLQDLIISALILHDGFKNGLEDSHYTVTEHPLICSEFIRGHSQFEDRDIVRHLIETHMGQWTDDFKTHEKVLEKPDSETQKFVHLCDYLASRKCLEYKF
jgi:hypothetical protein